MHLTLHHIVLACAWAPAVLARPAEDASPYHQLNSRALTPDNTCGNIVNGNNQGYTCDPNNHYGGPCCSPSGYCGSGAAYCGTGCQRDFGTCSGSDSIPPIDPFQCGPNNANNKCTSGLCCSQSGWCGNSTDYCGAGCQSGFGDCTATSGGGSDGTCGPAFGNKKCPTGQCCSSSVCTPLGSIFTVLTSYRGIVVHQKSIAAILTANGLSVHVTPALILQVRRP